MTGPPLRKVVSSEGACNRLECGHIVDRRGGFKQPKRMRCIICMPVDERQRYLRVRK